MWIISSLPPAAESSRRDTGCVGRAHGWGVRIAQASPTARSAASEPVDNSETLAIHAQLLGIWRHCLWTTHGGGAGGDGWRVSTTGGSPQDVAKFSGLWMGGRRLFVQNATLLGL